MDAPLFQDNVLVCFASKEESFFLQKGCSDLQIFLPQSFHRDAILTWTRLSNPATQLSRLLLRLGRGFSPLVVVQGVPPQSVFFLSIKIFSSCHGGYSFFCHILQYECIILKLQFSRSLTCTPF